MTVGPETMTPWGETLAELSLVILTDRSAPPVAVLAAAKARMNDQWDDLAGLVSDAMDLHRADMEAA